MLHTRTKERPYKAGRELFKDQAAANIVYLWRTMTPLEQSAFAWLGPYVPDWEGRRAARPLSAYQTFQSLCRARQAINLPLTPIAPRSVDLPPALGNLTLTAAVFPAPPVLGPGGLALRLTPETPYPYPCQIWAARPQLASTKSVLTGKYAAIAAVPSLPAEGVELQDEFYARFYRFQVGHRLFVRVCPISPSGFRGQTVPVDAIVMETMEIKAGEKPIFLASQGLS